MSDRIARAFNRSGATRAVHLIYLRFMTGYHMLVFFTNLSLTEFQLGYLALFLLSSVIDGFECLASDLWQQLELASEPESDL